MISCHSRLMGALTNKRMATSRLECCKDELQLSRGSWGYAKAYTM